MYENEQVVLIIKVGDTAVYGVIILYISIIYVLIY